METGDDFARMKILKFKKVLLVSMESSNDFRHTLTLIANNGIVSDSIVGDGMVGK